MSATATDPGAATRLDRVHVHESGNPDAPAVVFVHGGGPSGAMWRDHLDRLASRFHCLAPDLPGFGRSNTLPSISLAETADLVAALIVARVPSGRAHVVGLSYGGSVVFALLDRHPDVLDRVVIDGASVLSERLDRVILAAITLVSPIVNTRLTEVFLGRIGLRGLGLALRTATPAAFRRSWMEGYTAPLSKAELEADCPTLLVAGEREHARESNAALAELMPHATARFVRGLGHAWFVWKPELHLRMVEAWLSGEALPEELEPEPPSPAAVARVRRRLAAPRKEGTMTSYIRPGFLISRVANPILRHLSRAPALIVRGRRSGRLLTVPMGEPLVFDGRRYLVSGRGQTHWVRNLRAAGRAAFRLHGSTTPFRATEVSGEEHDRIVDAYRRTLGHRVDAYFAEIPDLGGHPVFRMDPMSIDSLAGARG